MPGPVFLAFTMRTPRLREGDLFTASANLLCSPCLPCQPSGGMCLEPPARGTSLSLLPSSLSSLPSGTSKPLLSRWLQPAPAHAS